MSEPSYSEQYVQEIIDMINAGAFDGKPLGDIAIAVTTRIESFQSKAKNKDFPIGSRVSIKYGRISPKYLYGARGTVIGKPSTKELLVEIDKDLGCGVHGKKYCGARVRINPAWVQQL